MSVFCMGQGCSRSESSHLEVVVGGRGQVLDDGQKEEVIRRGVDYEIEISKEAVQSRVDMSQMLLVSCMGLRRLSIVAWLLQ